MDAATHRSPWIATAPGPPYRTSRDLPAETDVAVLGAGVVGLTTALALAAEGRSVVVVDAGVVGHGVTGHSTVKATTAQGSVLTGLADTLGEEEAAVYAESNSAGLAHLRALVAEHGIDCDLSTGPHVLYARDEDGAEQVRAEAELAARSGLDVEVPAQAPLPFAVTAAASFPDQVSLHPVRYLQGLARALTDAGGTLVEGVRALGVTERAGGCEVSTSAGTLRTRAVVVATHYPFLDRGLHFARLSHQRAYGVAAVLPEDVAVGMTYAVGGATRSTRTVELDGERLVVVVGEGHPVGEVRETDQAWRALADWARTELGAGPVRYTWSTQDVSSLDGLPYVGWATPGTEAVLTATGFAGWGMTNGTAAALLLADLLAGRENPWAEALDARRLNLRATAGRLVSQNLEVGAHFVGDRLRSLRGGDPEQLAPGQAEVLRVGGRHLACYRDDDGELHTLSARCTHLGCLVAWNAGERSWDCPCHASRFDHTGAVLQGPAVRPLPPA